MVSGNIGIGKTTATTALDVSGAISTNNVINLTYTAIPTYTANHIGYTISGRSAYANLPSVDITIANPGVYMLTWWIWITPTTGSGTGYIELSCTENSANTGNNSTLDGLSVHSNLIYASGNIYQGGNNNMRILRPSTANKIYYLRTSFPSGYVNSSTVNYINYMYVRIA